MWLCSLFGKSSVLIFRRIFSFNFDPLLPNKSGKIYYFQNFLPFVIMCHIFKALLGIYIKTSSKFKVSFLNVFVFVFSQGGVHLLDKMQLHNLVEHLDSLKVTIFGTQTPKIYVYAPFYQIIKV